jgi:hypothetical protein
VHLLLLAGIAFLLVATIHTWWGEGDLPSQGPSSQGLEIPTAPIFRDQQPLSSFKLVAAKNLFSQDRNDPTGGMTNVQNTLEGRHLLGTLIIGDTKAAIIGGNFSGAGKGAPEVDAVYLGEEWHGFKVLEISNDSVTFHGTDGRKTLKFPEQGSQVKDNEELP